MPTQQEETSNYDSILQTLKSKAHLCSLCFQRAGVPFVAIKSDGAVLDAMAGTVYLSQDFVRSLLFSCRKVILRGGAGNALWKQEAQVIHVLWNVRQGETG